MTLTVRRTLLTGFAYLAALAVFFALRLVHLAHISGSPVVQIPIIDSLYYLNWGRRIAEGLGLGPHPFFMSPLYPLFIALAGSIGEGFTMSTLHAQLVLSALTMLLIGRYAGRRIDHWLGGPAAALLFALYAPAIYYDGVLLSASLILFLTMVAVTLLDDEPASLPAWRVAAAGLAIGLSALARPNALVLAVAFAVAFLAWGWRARPTSRGVYGRPVKQALARVVILLVTAALVILPAMLRNHRLSGQFMLTTSSAGMNLFIGNHGQANGLYTEAPWLASAEPADEAAGYEREAERRTGVELNTATASAYWAGEAVEWVASNPLDWLALEAKKLAYFFHSVESPNNVSFYGVKGHSPVLRALAFFSFGVLAALALPGLFGFGRGPRSHLPRALLLAYLAASLLFFVAGEYRYPVAGILCVYAAVTVFRIVERVRADDPIPALRAAIVIVALILVTHIPWPTMRALASSETDFFNWASVSYREGDLKNASLLYSAALAERPGWRDAHLQLALVFTEMGLHDLATREFEAAGVSQEDITRLRVEEELLAENWFGGDSAMAEMSAGELTNLAARFNSLGRAAAALSAAEHALAKDSTNLGAKFERAFALERGGRLQAAIQAYQRIEVEERDDPMLAYRIAWCYYGLGEGRQAQQSLQRAKVRAKELPEGPYRAKWLEKLAEAEIKLGNY